MGDEKFEIDCMSAEEIIENRQPSIGERIVDIHAKNLVKKREKLILETIYEYMPSMKEKPIEEIAKTCEIKTYVDKPDIEELWFNGKNLITFFRQEINHDFSNEYCKMSISQNYIKHI